MKTIAFPRCSQWSSPSLFRDRRGKEKRQKIQQKEGKTKAATTLSEADSSNSQQIPLAGRESLSEKQNELQLESLNLESVQENVSHKKEKNKKVPIIPTLTKSISGDNTYICTVCERTFRRAAALCWHMKYDHKSKEDDSDNSESSENESMREELAARDEDFNVKTETEGRDDQQFEVLTGQEIHVILENCQDQGRKKKEDTKKTHRVKKKVGKHLQEDNNSPRDKPYTCNMCGREFKELTVLKAHGLVHSDERKYKCEFENCPYGFKTKGGLVRHMRRHTGERPYACKRCGRTFSASGTLTRHMKALRNCSETPNSAYPSYMKKRAYHPNIPAVIDPEQRGARRGRSILPQPQASVQEEDRDIHYIITDTAGPDTVEADVVDPDAAGVEGMEPGTVVADTIGSQLVSEGDSVAEIKQEKNDTEEWSTETGEVEENSDVNTMAGTEMGSSVIKTQESALLIQRHDSTSISSSGQHTFTCNICGKEFKALAILKAHGLVHSDERKYKCEFENCPHGFKRKSGLVRHMRRHTGERPYKCKRCGRTFSESGARTRHMKARRGCSKTPDSAYPGYMKNWTYHPNIPAVIDPNGLRGRSTLPQPQASVQGVTVVQHEEGDIHYIITDTAGPDTVEADVVDPDTVGVDRVEPSVAETDISGSQLVSVGDSVVAIKPEKGDTEEWSTETREVEGNSDVNTMAGTEMVSSVIKTQESTLQTERHDSTSASSLGQCTFTCNICGREFKELTVLKAHGLVHSDERKYKCEFENCPYGFKRKGDLVRHMRRHTGERPYACKRCGRTFSESGALSRHMKAPRNCSKTPDSAYPGYMKNWTYHPNIPAVIDPEQRDGLRGRSTLPQPQVSVQGVTVFQHEERDIHYIITDTAGPDTVEADVVDPDTAGVERIEPGMVVTDVVGSQLVSEGGSVAEIKQNKGGDTEDIEASVLAMEEEEGSTTKPGALQNRKSVLRDALVAVKQLYSLKKNKGPSEISKPGPSATGSLQCMVCNRFFRGSSYLRQHMRTHTGDRPYQCQHCNRSFTTRSNLKRHMYVHKKQRDFKCGECGKLFKCLAHVQQHLKIHSQEHSFKCIVCEKLFKTQNSLKIHLRTHSGVNPYKCQVCSRHFPESGSLQRHMRLHTGEKPYKCPRCHRGFAEKATMTRHLKAKMRCSSTRDATNVDMNQSINTTMLAQFSSMGADTQQYILPEADGGHQYIMPAVQDQEMNENYVVLQTTGDGSEEVSENLEVNKQEEKVSSSGSDAQETHEIVDPSTGESLIIVASKSVVDLVRNLQPSLESDECGSSLQKIKDILFAAGGGYITTATSFEQEESVGVEELSTAPEKENIKEETEVLEK